VFVSEPLKDSPYFNVDNVILTPHIAGSTDEAQEAIGIQIARQVRDYLKLGIVQHAVNMPSLSHEEYLELAPYLDMAESLGTFLASISTGTGSVESVHLSYNGKLATAKTDLLRNAALKGVLGHSENVNRINAASIAEERGVRVHEAKKEQAAGGAGSILKLELHTSAGHSDATATVLHGRSPRLLSCDGIDIEAPLHGTLLFIRNQDVPGVIGRIGTILGHHSVNIANFALGRDHRSGKEGGKPQALAVIQIDGAIAPDVRSALEAVDAITQVRSVELATA
jgi:D-3-phosphoglycerate dehydrogenase